MLGGAYDALPSCAWVNFYSKGFTCNDSFTKKSHDSLVTYSVIPVIWQTSKLMNHAHRGVAVWRDAYSQHFLETFFAVLVLYMSFEVQSASQMYTEALDRFWGDYRLTENFQRRENFTIVARSGECDCFRVCRDYFYFPLMQYLCSNRLIWSCII